MSIPYFVQYFYWITDSKDLFLGGLLKWEPRFRIGIYIGQSPDHAGNATLALNPTTKLVSPQYDVVFDDRFSTVNFSRAQHLLRIGKTYVNYIQKILLIISKKLN